MFSQTAEYALRALTFLAQRFPGPQSTAVIAGHTQVPAGYLSKVLQQLGRASLVHAVRGKHGGWELARAPGQTTILEIINTVDPVRRIRACPLHLDAHAGRLCPLHEKMDRALEQIENSFSSTTLADLLNVPGSPVPLCNRVAGRVEVTR